MKNVTLDIQTGGITAKNPEDVAKEYPFVKMRKYKKFSGWYCCTVEYTNYGFEKNGKTFWFSLRTSDKDAYYDYDDILVILKSLKDNQFKYAVNYCGKGMLGSPNKFTDINKFMDYVNERGYTYQKEMTSLSKIDDGYWRFFGNVDQESSAFWFDIFDQKTLKKVEEKTKIKREV